MRLDLRQFFNHWGNLVDILNKVRILTIFNDVWFAHWIVMTNKYHFQHVSRVTFHCKLFVWFTEDSFGRTIIGETWSKYRLVEIVSDRLHCPSKISKNTKTLAWTREDFIKFYSLTRNQVRNMLDQSTIFLSLLFLLFFVLFSFISMRHFVLKESYMLSLTVCSNLTSCMNLQCPGVNRMSAYYLFVVSMILLPYFICCDFDF